LIIIKKVTSKLPKWLHSEAVASKSNQGGGVGYKVPYLLIIKTPFSSKAAARSASFQECTDSTSKAAMLPGGRFKIELAPVI